MKDTEILRTIYRWLQQANSRDENPDHTRQRLRDFQNFIEQEWQREDDEGLVQQYNRNREVKDHVSSADEIRRPDGLYARGDDWYSSAPCTTDVKEIERHRGLEIGEDGTVTDLK